jgi:hypothetical protein
MSIYEVHLGSWMRVPEEGRWLTYRELAPARRVRLALGFTHVELLPVMEHPFYGSWGYQTTGYFAPTSRYGTPQDFMFLVDTLHQARHRRHPRLGARRTSPPTSTGSATSTARTSSSTRTRAGLPPRLEERDLQLRPPRGAGVPDLERAASGWRCYHVDGLRVDAVASMLYLDYSRPDGEWIPNEHGGRENLGAIRFLRELNAEVYRTFPDVQTIAEESTAWPMVSRPVYVGGLGFGFKWDMGWMHDTLAYLALDPVYRRYHHNDLTFRHDVRLRENFVLPSRTTRWCTGRARCSARCPATTGRSSPTCACCSPTSMRSPGKKLLFMGGEFGQLRRREWNHDAELDWHLSSMHGRERSVTLTLPPLSISFFRMVPVPSAAVDFEEAPDALADIVGIDPLDDAPIDGEAEVREVVSAEDVVDALEVLSVVEALDALESVDSIDAELASHDDVEVVVEVAVMDEDVPGETLDEIPEAEVVRTETERPAPRPSRRKPAARKSTPTATSAEPGGASKATTGKPASNKKAKGDASAKTSTKQPPSKGSTSARGAAKSKADTTDSPYADTGTPPAPGSRKKKR